MLETDDPSCNARIAAALLDVLAESGDVGARARVLQMAGADGASLRRTAWIHEKTLRAMLRALPPDRNIARHIGRRLISPAGIGFYLCYAGVATLEKAYRRSEQLLARESRGGSYEVRAIAEESATVVYHPEPGLDPEPLYCGIRRGMLEAMPLLFGLLPADVNETECAQQDGKKCVFEVRWRRSTRMGLAVGAGVGLVFGLLAGWLLAPASLSAVLLSGVVLCVLAAAAGRSIDLARQLEAVAGARRGQLALLEQADRTLAEKMDQLAKVGDALAAAGNDSSSDEDSRAVAASAGREIRLVARGLVARVADLHRQLVHHHGSTDYELAAQIEACGEGVQRLQAVAERLIRPSGSTPSTLELASLPAIVSEALDAVRPSLGAHIALATDLDDDLPPLRCDAFQIEQVVIALLQNARDAIEGAGRIWLRTALTVSGIEIVVEDDGAGIEEELLEKMFDPFASESESEEGVELGSGLTACYRIVRENRGELRVESEPGKGTRVAVILPAD